MGMRMALAVLTCLITGPSNATSPRVVAPAEVIQFAEAEVVFDAEVLAGGSRTRLLQGAPDREQRLSATLKREIATALAGSGIVVEDDAEDFVSLNVYGHSEDVLGIQVFAYVLELMFVRENHYTYAKGHLDRRLARTTKAVGVSIGDQLEERIVADLNRLLQRQLEARLTYAGEQ